MTDTAPVTPPARVPPRAQSSVRWFLYVGLTLICAGLLVVLESTVPELASAVFTLLILASLLYIVFRSADKIGHAINELRMAVAYPVPFLLRHAAGLSLTVGVCGGGLAILSALSFWESHAFLPIQDDAAKMFLVAVLLLWVGFALHPMDLPLMSIIIAPPAVYPAVSGFAASLRLFIRRAGKRMALFIGITIIALLTEINAQFIQSDLLGYASLHVQFILLLLGTGLLVVGLTGVRMNAVARPAATRLEHLRPLWPLALITLLALVLRLWQLDTALRVLVDERSFIDGLYAARDSAFNGLLQPFSGIAAFPYIYPYWQSLAFGLFGGGLVGVRAASAIVGTLTVPALYFLARTAFDRPSALLAALLLATFPPHLQFSRIGLNNIADPLFGTLALAFLLHGFKTHRRVDFVLAGVMLGFTQYFYEGGRLLFVPLLWVAVIGCIFFARIPDRTPLMSPWGAVLLRVRRVSGRIFLMLAAFVIIALPIYLTLAGLHRPVLTRFGEYGLGLGPAYWQAAFTEPDGLKEHLMYHILPAFEMYFNQIDTTFFYSKTTALLLTGVLPFAMLGFAFVSYHWRKPGPMLLVLWIVATSLGNSLMKDSSSSSRFVAVFPALALLIAIGLRYGIPLIVRWPRFQIGIIAAFGIGLALYQINFFFNQHLPDYNLAVRISSPGPDGYDAAWRSLQFPPHTQVHVISDPVDNPIEVQGLILPWRTDITADTLLSSRLSPRYLENLPCEMNHAFFVQKKDEKVIDMLRSYFKLDPPRFTPFTDIPVSEQLVLYFAPYPASVDVPYNHHCKIVGKTS